MFSKNTVINERSIIIPINKKYTTNNEDSPKYLAEYSLKQNFFDPSKSSPPNEFLIKLRKRINQFDSFNSLDSLDDFCRKRDNLVNE